MLEMSDLEIGAAVIFTADYDFSEYGLVEAGEQATVLSNSAGVSELLLQNVHPAMAAWDNVITLVAGETDDILGILGQAAAWLMTG